MWPATLLGGRRGRDAGGHRRGDTGLCEVDFAFFTLCVSKGAGCPRVGQSLLPCGETRPRAARRPLPPLTAQWLLLTSAHDVLGAAAPSALSRTLGHRTSARACPSSLGPIGRCLSSEFLCPCLTSLHPTGSLRVAVSLITLNFRGCKDSSI